MQVSKETLYKLGTTLEPKSCKIFLTMYGMADSEGNVNTSLKDLSDRSGISVTTIRRTIQELRDADILDVSHVVGVQTNYKLKNLK